MHCIFLAWVMKSREASNSWVSIVWDITLEWSVKLKTEQITHSLEKVGHYHYVNVVELCETVYFLK